MNFIKATKKRAKARFAIDGPSGSGKTYTALIAATALADGGKIAVVDTERGSASLYSDVFDFDVLELDTYSPELYTKAIKAAEEAGYAVIVIDSLSHAWEGEGGALDLVDNAAARSRSGNSYTAWRDVTPIHRRMVDTILQSKAHVIVTMRSKMEYIIETNSKGQQVPRKVGMAPIQRQGMEYEFTVVADMDVDNKMIVSKTRFSDWAGVVQSKPDVKFFRGFVDWLNGGETVKEQPMPKIEYQPVAELQPVQAQSVTTNDDGTRKKYPGDEEFLRTFELPRKFSADLTLEEARAIKGSDRKTYGSKSLEELYYMLYAIGQQVSNNGLSDAEKVVASRKSAAIMMLVNERKQAQMQGA